jgi:hypothetical protein
MTIEVLYNPHFRISDADAPLPRLGFFPAQPPPPGPSRLRPPPPPSSPPTSPWAPGGRPSLAPPRPLLRLPCRRRRRRPPGKAPCDAGGGGAARPCVLGGGGAGPSPSAKVHLGLGGSGGGAVLRTAQQRAAGWRCCLAAGWRGGARRCSPRPNSGPLWLIWGWAGRTWALPDCFWRTGVVAGPEVG